MAPQGISMTQTIQGQPFNLLTRSLPIASLLLNWWAASLCIVTLFSGCLGTLYGLFQETLEVWLSLLLAVGAGALLHSVVIVLALTICVIAEPTT